MPTTPEQIASLLYGRRSVRRYADREVERAKVDWILEMTATAPMGIPPSDVGVVVFHGKEKVERFAAEMCASFKQMSKQLNPFMLGLMRLWSKKTDYEMLRDFVVPLLKMLSKKHEEGEDKFTYVRRPRCSSITVRRPTGRTATSPRLTPCSPPNRWGWAVVCWALPSR